MSVSPSSKSSPFPKRYESPPRLGPPVESSEEKEDEVSLSRAEAQDKNGGNWKKVLLSAGTLMATTATAQTANASPAVEMKLTQSQMPSTEVPDLHLGTTSVSEESFTIDRRGNIDTALEVPRSIEDVKVYRDSVKRAKKVDVFAKFQKVEAGRLRRIDNSYLDLDPARGRVVYHDSWSNESGNSREVSSILEFEPGKGTINSYQTQVSEVGVTHPDDEIPGALLIREYRANFSEAGGLKLGYTDKWTRADEPSSFSEASYQLEEVPGGKLKAETTIRSSAEP